MHGDLRTTSLEQLCRTLDARQATGELVITGDDNQIRIWFRQGRVVRAAASKYELRLGDRLVHGGLLTAKDLQAALRAQSGSGKHLGEVLVDEGLVSRHVVRAFMQEQVLDALFAAHRWTSGAYEFDEDDVPGTAVPTDLTVPQLLFALESRHRMWDEITRTIPDLDRVPEFVPGASPDASHVEPGEQAVVRAIDGARSVAEISEELGFGPYEVAAVVHGLTVLGLVRLGGGDEDSPPSAVSEDSPVEAVPASPENAAAAAATAISEAAAFLRGDGPAPTPLHEKVPATAEPADEAPPAPAPAPTGGADAGTGPSGVDFAASLAGVMAELDIDGPRTRRAPIDAESEESEDGLAILAPDPLSDDADAPVPVAEAGLDVPPSDERATGDDDLLAAAAEAAAGIEAPAPAMPDAPAAPPPAPAPAPDEDEETTFVVVDDDLDPEPRTPTPAPIPPMDSMPARPDFSDEDEADPEPWAFVIGDGEEDEAEAPRPRRQPSSPITAAVPDVATGTPLPTPSTAPPDPRPAAEASEESADEPESDIPAAPQRPRQTGEMTDLLRELRQLSDE